MPPSSLWCEISLSGLCTIVGFPLLMALAMVSVPAGFWATSLVGAVIVVAFVLSQREARTLHESAFDAVDGSSTGT
jgi:lipid-A-disaccharide synthase-like uncharacterized protein